MSSAGAMFVYIGMLYGHQMHEQCYHNNAILLPFRQFYNGPCILLSDITILQSKDFDFGTCCRIKSEYIFDDAIIEHSRSHPVIPPCRKLSQRRRRRRRRRRRARRRRRRTTTTTTQQQQQQQQQHKEETRRMRRSQCFVQ